MEDKNLVVLGDLNLVTKDDMKFLKEHSNQFLDRYSRRSLFRSKFEMEASVLNDMVHPTVDSKYWQAIGEQAVHVQELVRLGYSGKKSEAEIELYQAQIEELEDKKQQAELNKQPDYIIKKFNARIKKKEIEVQEKQFGLTECKKVAKERIKEIKNWEEIIPELEANLKWGKEDWEKHHPERSLLRNEISMRNFELLDLDSKKNAVRDFTAAVKHKDNKELVLERRQMLANAGAGQETYNRVEGKPVEKEEEDVFVNRELGTIAGVKKMIEVEKARPTVGEVKPPPEGLKLAGVGGAKSTILEQPKVSALKDHQSKGELIKKDKIAKEYFDRKVRRILVGTPHRNQTDQNITNMNMLQMPAAVDSMIESPWGFNVPDARNVIVQRAFEEGADYIFFIDDDMIVPRNALVQLFHILRNSKNALMAGGSYYRKYFPLESVEMLEAEDTTPYALDGNAEIGKIYHDCLVLPSGCTLIDMKLFEMLEEPYYVAHTIFGKAALTEDTVICQKARNLGVDIILDTGIQCLHVDKQTGQIYGHENIVDPRSNTINTKYARYFAAEFTE